MTETPTDPLHFDPAEYPYGYRLGDLVEIISREGETDATPPVLRLNGTTGTISELDADNPEYPIGLAIEGWLGPVWCSPWEIQRIDAAGPAERGFTVGDVVQITGRGLEHDGHAFEGHVGRVIEIRDDPQHPIGLAVDGVEGTVWCNSAEIRHYGEDPEFPSAEARDEYLAAVAWGEAGVDR